MKRSVDPFLLLVRPHWRRLRQVARRYLAHEQDADDLVQETLLRAWRSFDPAREESYHRGWLYVILRNVAAEWDRTTRRRIRLVPTGDTELTDLVPLDLTEPFAPLPAMDEERFREFLDDRLSAALDALAAPYREVIVLSVAGGLNYREIAEVLNCPLGTVMSRIARARRVLRERLVDLAPSPRRPVEKRA